jgi:hypothetical protein
MRNNFMSNLVLLVGQYFLHLPRDEFHHFYLIKFEFLPGNVCFYKYHQSAPVTVEKLYVRQKWKKLTAIDFIK